MRGGADNAGGPTVSTDDCMVAAVESSALREWPSAYWDPDAKQSAYGLWVCDGGRTPLPSTPDLNFVFHEVIHEVTDRPERFQLVSQSAAMIESYSDFFGVLIQTTAEPQRSKWQHEVAIGFSFDDVTLRDM